VVHHALLVSNNSYTCQHPLTDLTALLLGILAITLFLLVAFREHPGYMPTGATCSLVLSAACHQPLADVNASTEPVQWGVVPFEDAPLQIQLLRGKPPEHTSTTTTTTVVSAETASLCSIGWLFDDPFVEVDGHCCFSTHTVMLPLSGRTYI
jgi:hypothetical protein